MEHGELFGLLCLFCSCISGGSLCAVSELIEIKRANKTPASNPMPSGHGDIESNKNKCSGKCLDICIYYVSDLFEN
jgi:hypothetical protein